MLSHQIRFLENSFNNRREGFKSKAIDQEKHVKTHFWNYVAIVVVLYKRLRRLINRIVVSHIWYIEEYIEYTSLLYYLSIQLTW